MYDDDDTTFSLVSTASVTDATSITTRTELELDHGDEDAEFAGVSDVTSDFESGWEVSSGPSTSVPPSVYEDEIAYGRRYHGFRRGIYPMPNDEVERHREETVHALFLQLMGGHLFYANIGDHPQKIIDIGTGIGIWPIDVADQHPSASVIGTDLSPIQPSWVPINVRMFIEDSEEPEWLHGSEFDLVHFRQMTDVLRDLKGLLTKIYPHVKNGGWVEFHELMTEIRCDDGTMKDDDPLRVFLDTVKNGLRVYGINILAITELEQILRETGFSNVHCITKKVPISTWPRDKTLRALGVFMKTTINDSLGAMAAKPLAALNLSPEQRVAMLEAARDSLQDDTIHRYVNCCVCYAQKREGHFAESLY
ncbi:methyltransferase domain-containing protein [Trichoderma breve]|uniref:Methyltransferase domain-containing protein n=1 Tax=Trichoderma breve TaxID=2034170 RepID=A0A9W9BFU0_9HYPO|nr:methyltransferase domain-containing protein [Trichoderma breve]KAJ4862360.1 methyltransferase domain-containing protein [Trichoderma breve]